MDSFPFEKTKKDQKPRKKTKFDQKPTQELPEQEEAGFSEFEALSQSKIEHLRKELGQQKDNLAFALEYGNYLSEELEKSKKVQQYLYSLLVANATMGKMNNLNELGTLETKETYSSESLNSPGSRGIFLFPICQPGTARKLSELSQGDNEDAPTQGKKNGIFEKKEGPQFESKVEMEEVYNSQRKKLFSAQKEEAELKKRQREEDPTASQAEEDSPDRRFPRKIIESVKKLEEFFAKFQTKSEEIFEEVIAEAPHLVPDASKPFWEPLMKVNPPKIAQKNSETCYSCFMSRHCFVQIDSILSNLFQMASGIESKLEKTLQLLLLRKRQFQPERKAEIEEECDFGKSISNIFSAQDPERSKYFPPTPQSRFSIKKNEFASACSSPRKSSEVSSSHFLWQWKKAEETPLKTKGNEGDSSFLNSSCFLETSRRQELLRMNQKIQEGNELLEIILMNENPPIKIQREEEEESEKEKDSEIEVSCFSPSFSLKKERRHQKANTLPKRKEKHFQEQRVHLEADSRQLKSKKDEKTPQEYDTGEEITKSKTKKNFDESQWANEKMALVAQIAKLQKENEDQSQMILRISNVKVDYIRLNKKTDEIFDSLSKYSNSLKGLFSFDEKLTKTIEESKKQIEFLENQRQAVHQSILKQRGESATSPTHRKGHSETTSHSESLSKFSYKK